MCIFPLLSILLHTYVILHTFLNYTEKKFTKNEHSPFTFYVSRFILLSASSYLVPGIEYPFEAIAAPMEDSFSFFQQTMRPLRVLISLRIDREGKEGERENEKERDKLRGCTGSPGISLFLICIVALLFSVPLGCSANVHACAFLRA